MFYINALLLGASGRIAAEKAVFGDWREVGRANTYEPVEVLLVLKRDPDALAKLEKMFWEVSDPKLEKYGQFLSQDEVTDLIGIQDDQLKSVTDYLSKNGAQVDVGAHKDLITARLELTKAEQMFQTELYKFQHTSRPRSTIIRTKDDSVTIPAELQDYVDYVDNIAGFPKLTVEPKRAPLTTTNRRRLMFPLSEETNQDYGVFPEEYSCNGMGMFYTQNHEKVGAVTPKVLAAAYKTDGMLAYGEAHGRMAVAEFGSEGWSTYQLGRFNQQCSVNATVDTQVGGNPPNYCNQANSQCTESLLDIEYISAVAGNIPLTDVATSQYSILTWANTIANMNDDTIPHVNSVSYGNDEAQNQVNYMDACSVEFQKLGLRGISIMFAAGDQGVWGREGFKNNVFHPDFPGGSPYITVVGGTNFAKSGVIGEEEAWTSGGGGFSNVHQMPAYQADFVNSYKKDYANELPSSQYWNTGNARAYPDVSALGGMRNPYLVFTQGRFEGVAGTSAATPVFSAIIAKLNSIRLSKPDGKPLGFLNPWLYQNADAFNDVTMGNNGGANPGSGFPATKGWDAATGLGTPNFEVLSQRL